MFKTYNYQYGWREGENSHSHALLVRVFIMWTSSHWEIYIKSFNNVLSWPGYFLPAIFPNGKNSDIDVYMWPLYIIFNRLFIKVNIRNNLNRFLVNKLWNIIIRENHGIVFNDMIKCWLCNV